MSVGKWSIVFTEQATPHFSNDINDLHRKPSVKHESKLVCDHISTIDHGDITKNMALINQKGLTTVCNGAIMYINV